VAVLWLSLTVLAGKGMVTWISESTTSDGQTATLSDLAVLLGFALVPGIAAWGVFRRRLWSYYLSLALSLYLAINSGYDFFALPFTGFRHWTPAILLVLAAVALAWLVSPTLRSEFPSGFRKIKAKVVGSC
jgi:hypothetical protein